MARSSRLSVCLAMPTRNSSQIHWHRSTSRQRTTPSIAAVGPLSIAALSAARCASFSFGGWPGALRVISPSGPWALNLITKIQERAVGGLSAATRRLLSGQEPAPVRRRRTLSPGTVLVREWHAVGHQVTIIEKGVLYRGKRYRSMSEVAR